jgi:hypothetical protein
MNRDVPQPTIFPCIVLVYAHAHQVGHDVRQPIVVIALHPNDFDIPLGIRQLSDVSEKFPVLFCEPRKIEVCKNVAQQYQPLEPILSQHMRGLARMARLCPQVQIREDQRVVRLRIHTSRCSNPLLRADEYCINFGA